MSKINLKTEKQKKGRVLVYDKANNVIDEITAFDKHNNIVKTFFYPEGIVFDEERFTKFSWWENWIN